MESYYTFIKWCLGGGIIIIWAIHSADDFWEFLFHIYMQIYTICCVSGCQLYLNHNLNRGHTSESVAPSSGQSGTVQLPHETLVRTRTIVVIELRAFIHRPTLSRKKKEQIGNRAIYFLVLNAWYWVSQYCFVTVILLLLWVALYSWVWCIDANCMQYKSGVQYKAILYYWLWP